MNKKTFEKINIKTIISSKQCAPLQNFGQFEINSRFWDQICLVTDNNFGKISIKFEMSI